LFGFCRIHITLTWLREIRWRHFYQSSPRSLIMVGGWCNRWTWYELSLWYNYGISSRNEVVPFCFNCRHTSLHPKPNIVGTSHFIPSQTSLDTIELVKKILGNNYLLSCPSLKEKKNKSMIRTRKYDVLEEITYIYIYIYIYSFASLSWTFGLRSFPPTSPSGSFGSGSFPPHPPSHS
jgi:hypothetical protein